MLADLRPALVLTLLFTLVLGLAYPLAVTGVAQAVFPDQANGSLVRNSAGHVIGSRRLAQAFSGAAYLHPRPSAAGADGYDASGSSGSNLGPLNPALRTRIAASADALRAEEVLRAGPPGGAIPADAVTTSGSGLDPDISPQNALRQAPRIAAERGLPLASVTRIILGQVTPPVLGFIGQPTVNVLETNLALDAATARAHPPGP